MHVKALFLFSQTFSEKEPKRETTSKARYATFELQLPVSMTALVRNTNETIFASFCGGNCACEAAKAVSQKEQEGGRPPGKWDKRHSRFICNLDLEWSLFPEHGTTIAKQTKHYRSAL